MPTTPILNIFYPLLSDDADVPADMQTMAESVEDYLANEGAVLPSAPDHQQLFKLNLVSTLGVYWPLMALTDPPFAPGIWVPTGGGIDGRAANYGGTTTPVAVSTWGDSGLELAAGADFPEGGYDVTVTAWGIQGGAAGQLALRVRPDPGSAMPAVGLLFPDPTGVAHVSFRVRADVPAGGAPIKLESYWSTARPNDFNAEMIVRPIVFAA